MKHASFRNCSALFSSFMCIYVTLLPICQSSVAQGRAHTAASPRFILTRISRKYYISQIIIIFLGLARSSRCRALCGDWRTPLWEMVQPALQVWPHHATAPENLSCFHRIARTAADERVLRGEASRLVTRFERYSPPAGYHSFLWCFLMRNRRSVWWWL